MGIIDMNILHIFLVLISLIFCSMGFILFSRQKLKDNGTQLHLEKKVSVIIPARNEEINLPHLLTSLKAQTYMPDEVIVVDDFSEDDTANIAQGYDVKLIKNPELPQGWTGKNWAVWNGYLESKGDILIFLDSDVRLAPNGIELLIKNRERVGGAISVVPYHYNEKIYERLSLILYLLGVFSFTAPSEREKEEKPLYGSCIAVTREDYEKISGHKGIQKEILDDMSLGMAFCREGINVTNFTGCETIKFRMYPGGIKNEFEGFSKGAVLGAGTLGTPAILMVACWVIGLLGSEIGLITSIFLSSPEFIIVFGIGYLLYFLELMYLTHYTGRYGILMPLFHFLPSIFFLVVLIYSIFRTSIYKNIPWKGRLVSVVQKDKNKR
jgi:4,4'-diaponeurosporenoate glycosyltransferase